MWFINPVIGLAHSWTLEESGEEMAGQSDNGD
jgi:hypothetical protein